MKRIVLSLVVALAAAASLAGGGGAAPAADPPSSASPPTIAGVAKEDQTLRASTGQWNGSTPMTFSFQWRRCDSDGHSCDDIGGARDQRYTLRGVDVGHRLRARVTAQNSAGSDAADSDPTDVVVAAHGNPPHNTSRPRIFGDFHEGGTLNSNVGSWSGTQPINFAIQWQRCPQGHDCFDLAGQNNNAYKPTSADVGSRIRINVVARNAFGSENAVSPLNVPVVQARGNAPANTAAPTISGSPVVGSVLTLNLGTWSGTNPINFAFRWQRCNTSGANCAQISGATGRTYRLTSADAGATLRGAVTAQNRFGTTSTLTAPSGVVGTPQPSGAIKLPSGLVSLPVSDVSLPQRLVIDQVSFNPRVLRSRDSFTASFRVRDTRGYVVRGALVLAEAIPFGRISAAPEAVTGTDGVATMTLHPTSRLPLIRGGFLVIFLRARKPGESILAGVSTRRLVSVRTGRP